eukprot:UN31838
MFYKMCHRLLRDPFMRGIVTLFYLSAISFPWASLPSHLFWLEVDEWYLNTTHVHIDTTCYTYINNTHIGTVDHISKKSEDFEMDTFINNPETCFNDCEAQYKKDQNCHAVEISYSESNITSCTFRDTCPLLIDPNNHNYTVVIIDYNNINNGDSVEYIDSENSTNSEGTEDNTTISANTTNVTPIQYNITSSELYVSGFQDKAFYCDYGLEVLTSIIIICWTGVCLSSLCCCCFLHILVWEADDDTLTGASLCVDLYKMSPSLYIILLTLCIQIPLFAITESLITLPGYQTHDCQEYNNPESKQSDNDMALYTTIVLIVIAVIQACILLFNIGSAAWSYLTAKAKYAEIIVT